MASIAETIAQLSQMGKTAASAGPDRLTALTGFGPNPGALRAHTFVPGNLSPHAPLVVVLHGCTQTAAGYDTGSGWSRLADEHGFALLFPEQQRANNANLCFNWFVTEDIARKGGEAESIRQMVDAMVRRHAIDPARVYVTGLSAGGAMATVMLATYPEVFAAGAVIAGLPYGAATGVGQAMARMRGTGDSDARTLAALVRSASSHSGTWPSLSVWHGTADATVAPSNADAIVTQWCDLHAVASAPGRTDTLDGHARRTWLDATGRVVITDHRIAGMGHGIPLATTGDDACGVAGPYMIEAGISSTRHIARSWGLAGPATRRKPSKVSPNLTQTPNPQSTGVAKVIEDALRSAGLMR